MDGGIIIIPQGKDILACFRMIRFMDMAGTFSWQGQTIKAIGVVALNMVSAY